MPTGMNSVCYSIVLGLTLFASALATDIPCAARVGDNGQGYICVCNSTYCDTVEAPDKLDKGLFYMYKTSNSTPGFVRTCGEFTKDMITVAEVIFTINSSAEYQVVEGFGAAITDSSGLNIQDLPQDAQDKLMESYFGPTGIEYNFLRVPIGGTDFSSRIYTLDDVPYDEKLKHFSLTDEDYNIKARILKYIIPFIKRAMNISERGINIMACTWLAPDWMKNNDTQGAQFISKKHSKVWAQYHIRFLEEYQKEGISIWGLTGGNEVMMMLMIPEQHLLNLTMASAPDQRSWLKNYLKPLLIANNFSDVKFITLEDERLFASYWMSRFANDPEALNMTDGIAIHTYSDSYTSYTILDDLNEAYPQVPIYYTETSINTGWGTDAVILGSWDRTETYLSSMFEALGHWSRTFLDWNLALDVSGGPARTYDIDGSVIVNVTSGEFYKQPYFYAMGHFSKFVPPGSKRVQVLTTELITENKEDLKRKASRDALQQVLSSVKSKPSKDVFKTQSLSVTKEIQCLAFVNPDDSYTILILNTKDESVRVKLEDSRVGSVTMAIEEHSINTFVYWP